MTDKEITEIAERRYPEQPGKHWVRILREAKVRAFIDGVKFANATMPEKIPANAKKDLQEEV